MTSQNVCMCTGPGHFRLLYVVLFTSSDFEHSKLLNKLLIFVYSDNDVDAFSDVILNSNQAVF